MNEYYGDDPGVANPNDGGLIAQLPSIIWQRKWYVIIPLILAMVGAVAAILILPRTYESGATLLVQSPTLPNDVIGSNNAADLINRRIESLRQQVVNRPKLLALIEENELYASERARKSLSSIIETMRDDITLTALDAGGGASDDKTIAFRLAFRYPDPRKAQTIAQNLMEQIVDLNSTADVASANQTVQFLKEQQNELRAAIVTVEQQISAFNARYGGVLSRSNTPYIGGAGGSYDAQINELNRANSMLQMQRRNLKTDDTRDPIVAGAESALAAARAVYAETHPDVIIAKQRLEESKKLAAQNVKKLPSENIDEQIAFNNQQIAMLRAAKAREMDQMTAVMTSQAQGPAVQQQATQLQQKLDSLNRQNDGLSQRLMTAEASARAANEQLGERLVVVDPPVIPDQPASPNRLLIAAIALAGGLGVGALLALLVEMFLHPIRTPGRITQITGAPTLALVPVIDSGDRRGAPNKPGFFKRILRNPFRRSKGEFA